MNFDWRNTLRMLPGIIVGLTFHEFLHGFVAWKLGDDTARAEGRVSFNPVRHIDPLGLIFIVILGFGWAKPVRIDRSKFKRPVRDEILVSIAGPAANLLLAFVLGAMTWVIFLAAAGRRSQILFELQMVVLLGMYVNLGLFVFNMIPVPPLDGSHIYLWKISRWNEALGVKVYRYGTFALFAVLFIGGRLNVDILPIGAATQWLASRILAIFGLRI